VKSPLTPLKTALLVALPIEILNFTLVHVPLDVGYSAGTSWYIELMASQWAYVHFPGLLFVAWTANTWLVLLGFVAIPVSGYIDTALLIFGSILGFRWLRRLAQKHSTRRN